jgi:H+-transporting ATPase
MTGIIIELCTRNKTDEVENQLEANVTECASRGLCALAVAYEELDHDNHEGEGNGFELIGLLAIFDPPRDDAKQTIDNAIALGIKVQLVTGDQRAIANRTNVGITVEGATDAARGAADIVLTEPGLSTIVHAIRSSRQIF